MRPFTAPISERSRQKYGTYQPRYQTESSMRPFVASVSDWKREKFGEYAPRYEEVKGMQPFDADISSYKRELYGDYQKRYETTSSMSAFDAELGSYKRDLYGDYRPRHSRMKVGIQGYGNEDSNGVNWVDLVTLEPTIHDLSVYRLYMWTSGAWAGVPLFRIVIGDVKVYPFAAYDVVVPANWVYLGTLSTGVKTGEVCKLQFKSTDAGDGAGEKLIAFMEYAELREI